VVHPDPPRDPVAVCHTLTGLVARLTALANTWEWDYHAHVGIQHGPLQKMVHRAYGRLRRRPTPRTRPDKPRAAHLTDGRPSPTTAIHDP
jgi:hypothetical protein